jgi:hypothetical protein
MLKLAGKRFVEYILIKNMIAARGLIRVSKKFASIIAGLLRNI